MIISIKASVTGNYKGANVFSCQNSKNETFLPDNTCYICIYDIIQLKTILKID